MPRPDFEKKRKTAWPWLAGIAALVMTLIGISTILSWSDDAGPEVTVPTVEDTHPPATIPAPPDVDPDGTGVDPDRAVEEIAPLGEDAIGQTISLDGYVVATGNASFWLLAGDRVVRVDSPRRVRKDDTLSIRGTLRPADPEKTDRIAAEVLSRRPGSDAWEVVRVVKLVEQTADATAGGLSMSSPEA